MPALQPCKEFIRAKSYKLVLLQFQNVSWAAFLGGQGPISIPFSWRAILYSRTSMKEMYYIQGYFCGNFLLQNQIDKIGFNSKALGCFPGVLYSNGMQCSLFTEQCSAGGPYGIPIDTFIMVLSESPICGEFCYLKTKDTSRSM